MKTKLFFSSLLSLLFASVLLAQDRTTVNATSSEISDNLDLRAVASIFGDSRDLEDFENRLNDPKMQISNLDLNGDNQVDYLRVIESVEGNNHLIVVQAVIGRDVFQDVATVEVQKDRNNRVQVQVVGDVFMYGNNYIYEPVYVSTPIIYTHFWAPIYQPYCSSFYWGFYPSYYTFWNPYPVFRYRHNVGIWINFNHSYNYAFDRRCQLAYNNYYGRRGNGYERQYPNRSFASRNSGYTNRRDLEKARPTRDVAFGTRGNSGTRNSFSDTPIRNANNIIKGNAGTVRSSSDTPIRNSSSTIKGNAETVRSSSETPIRNANSTIRGNSGTVRSSSDTPIRNSNSTIRGNAGTVRNSFNTPIRNSNSTRSENFSSSRNSYIAENRSNASRNYGNSGNSSRGNLESRGRER